MRFEAMLICEGCETERVDALSEEELHRLRMGDRLDRMCSECHTVTQWALVGEERREPVERRQGVDRRGGVERRERGRVRLHVPIEYHYTVAGMEYPERVTTVNISRSGVYFRTNKELRWGMKLLVTLPHSLVPDPKNPALEGRIVRIDRHPDKPQYGVAVHFEGVVLEI